MRGCLMPIAVCRFERGLMRALRHSDAMRDAMPATVNTTAQMPTTPALGSPRNTASAAASITPEAQPSNTKFTSVSGVAHSCRNLMQA